MKETLSIESRKLNGFSSLLSSKTSLKKVHQPLNLTSVSPYIT